MDKFNADSWYIDGEKKPENTRIKYEDEIINNDSESKKTNVVLTIITTIVLAISAICNIVSIVAMANDYYEVPDFIMRGTAALIQLTFAVLIPIFKKKSIIYIGMICAALFFMAESIIIMIYVYG